MYQIWIAIIGALIMAGGLGGVYYLIIKQNATIGAKSLQLVSVIFVMGLMLVLGVLNVIGRETIGPIVGVILGYVLAVGSHKE